MRIGKLCLAAFLGAIPAVAVAQPSIDIRVGVDAPRGVVIHRLEVMQAVTEANLEASRAAAEDGAALAGLLSARTRPPAAEPTATAEVPPAP